MAVHTVAVWVELDARFFSRDETRLRYASLLTFGGVGLVEVLGIRSRLSTALFWCARFTMKGAGPGDAVGELSCGGV